MILIQFIKRLKKLFIRKKTNNFQKEINKIKEKDKNLTNSNDKSLNHSNISNCETIKKGLLCYKKFGELKVYKRPIVKNQIKREQLFKQISKELEKIK